MTPFGARNTRGFWINATAKFPDRFADLLRQEVDLFRELEDIQGRALGCVKAGTFGEVGTLLHRQREVLEALETKRRELQPDMREYAALPEPEKSALRRGAVGELLQEVETAAAKIQSRHREHFDPPAAGGSSAASEIPVKDDLELRISRFRAGS